MCDHERRGTINRHKIKKRSHKNEPSYRKTKLHHKKKMIEVIKKCIRDDLFHMHFICH